MSEIADSKLDAKTKDENVKDANVKKASGEISLLGVLKQRRSVPALRLTDPGPNADDLEQLLTVATRVPDHGALEPWRIVVAQGSARQELADKLTAAFLRGATAQQDLAAADVTARKIRAVFTVAPLIVIVVSRADPSARIPEWEQIFSAGAVCMNLYQRSGNTRLQLDVAHRMVGIRSRRFENSRHRHERASSPASYRSAPRLIVPTIGPVLRSKNASHDGRPHERPWTLGPFCRGGE